MENKVIAVVVTYNRLTLLKQCIGALRSQSCPCDILVVNNGCSDGTEQWLAECSFGETGLYCLNTGANLGGAGGFHRGLRWAVARGYEHIWLMDDDTLPQAEALEKLLAADSLLEGKYGWLSSVALWTDGGECKMNRQKLKKSYYEYSPLLAQGLVQAEQATFVSLFLRRETVLRVGLPVADYFIWGDDIEYTRRIAVRAGLPCFVAGQSRVVHAMQDNCGSSIATDRPERLDRYRYAFRNEAHLYRQEGLKGVCYYIAKCGLNLLRVLAKAEGQTCRRCGIILGGMVRGCFFRPETEYCEVSDE